MLHRYSHTLPWSVSKLGKPSDLPDVLREDLLLLIPVDPYKIFAAWNVSYQTQNTVSKLLGESVSSVSRLVIHIEGAYQDTSSLSLLYDVSGPNRSRYLQVKKKLAQSDNHMRLRGKLGYQIPNSEFYPITASTPTLLPAGRAFGIQVDTLPMQLFKQACQPTVLKHSSLSSSSLQDSLPQPHSTSEQYSPLQDPRLDIDLQKMADIFDLQMGRLPIPEGIYTE